MKLTSVILNGGEGVTPVVLGFRDPGNTNPYQAKSILGLDAEDILKRYAGAGVTGTKFYDFKLPKRDIVVVMGLNPRWDEDESYSDLRDDVYRLISAARTGQITVEFLNGLDVLATVVGSIEKLETDHFVKTPEVKLTLGCSDPILRAPNVISVPTEELLTSGAEIEDPLSTAPHGLYFEATFTAATTTFLITGPSGWKFQVTPIGVGGFAVGDIVRCSSEHGARRVEIKRGATVYSIADGIHQGSIWPTMLPNMNVFSTTSPVNWTKFEYRPAYWGV